MPGYRIAVQHGEKTVGYSFDDRRTLSDLANYVQAKGFIIIPPGSNDFMGIASTRSTVVFKHNIINIQDDGAD